MWGEIINGMLGATAALCAILFGYLAWKRLSKKDVEESSRANGVIASDIGYIKKAVDDIGRKQEKQDEKYIETITRLTSVEASAKQAHKRIDELIEKDSK